MKANRITLVAIATLLITSCSIYHPQSVDIPLINHRGDTRIDASMGASVWLILPDVVTFNTTASYGFNDWLCGQVHANYGGENFYLQAAPGAYLPLGGKAVAEAYIGYGYGGAWQDNRQSSSSESSESSESSNGGHTYNGNFTLPFVQLNIGWHNLGPMHIAFGLKSGVFQPDFEYHSYSSDGTENPSGYEHYMTPNALVEPQLQVGIGSDLAKFTVRMGYSWLSDLESGSSKMHHDFFSLSAGLTFSF